MIDQAQASRIHTKRALQIEVDKEDARHSARVWELTQAIDDALTNCTHLQPDGKDARHGNICRICGDLHDGP